MTNLSVATDKIVQTEMVKLLKNKEIIITKLKENEENLKGDIQNLSE